VNASENTSASSVGDESMRREVVPLRSVKRPVGRALPRSLSDGVVTLRLPVAEDVDRAANFAADPALLEGVWIPGPQPGENITEWAARFIEELSVGWTTVGGIYGGGFIVDESRPFVGIVYVIRRAEDVVELAYGVAPPARGRGIATRAARIAADWALTDGGFAQVELRIGSDHAESRRVAEKAGFRFKERFLTYVEGTGETCEDVLYVRGRK
jgi:RimJ/RimL family protein N-acetyltransferase